MARLLHMPEVSANLEEAVLTEWTVGENTPFAAEDVLMTIETDKAVVDVEAEADGKILRTLVDPGTSVAVGAPIAVLADPGEVVVDIDALLAQFGVAASVPESENVVPPAEPTKSPNGVVGFLRTEERIFASPLVRRLAAGADIELASLSGSGPKGRIRKIDLEQAISERGSAAAVPASAPVEPIEATVVPSPPAPGGAPALTAGAESTPGFTDEEHSRLRRAVATRLAQSKQTVPHFYVRGSARVDALAEFRAQVNAGSGVKVSFNDLVVKAVAVAHREHPDMNVIWTESAVRRFEQVDVAVAVASDRGLVTPVLRDVGRSTLTDVSSGTRDLVERANAGRLRQPELEGGSISVSNLGMFGTEEFTAIINPPQSAILAVGGIRQEPVVVDGALEVCKVMRFVLSVDHRPIDGALAAQWMKTFLEVIEHPVRIVV